jgi:ferrous iron transport protein B
VASLPAKEITVSTLGVLYGEDDANTLSEALAADSTFPPASAMAMMVFMLLCFPCLATLSAIYSESKKIKWVFFTIVYNTAIAWALAFITYRVCNFIL